VAVPKKSRMSTRTEKRGRRKTPRPKFSQEKKTKCWGCEVIGGGKERALLGQNHGVLGGISRESELIQTEEVTAAERTVKLLNTNCTKKTGPSVGQKLGRTPKKKPNGGWRNCRP